MYVMCFESKNTRISLEYIIINVQSAFIINPISIPHLCKSNSSINEELENETQEQHWSL
jgi:hypothetical protein